MECYPLKHSFLSRTTLVFKHHGSGQGLCYISKRVDVELQSEVHSQGSSSFEPSFSSAFLTEGEMFYMGNGLRQVGTILTLRERISSPPEACCAFVPQLSAPCFLTSFLNCSCGLFLRDTLACRFQFICSPLLTTGESAHCSLEMLHW